MTRPLRLLFYTHATTGGGAERVWASLAAKLAARGHAVTFAYDHEENPAPIPGVALLHLGRGHARAVLGLRRHLAAEQPDISISALGVSNLKHVLAAIGAGRHRHALISFHGHPQSEPERLSRLGNRATPLLSRLTARSVFVSEGLRDHYVRESGAARTHCIHNPVEITAAVPARDVGELAARGPAVLAVGRLVPAKDFPTLVRAFARLRADARLVIVGEGPERGAIEAEIARLGLGDRARLAGHVEQPWRFYREAACYVSSSRAEAFGNVVVEALAHGLPVVATACDGPAEILADGAHGCLVPVGDEAAMAEAIAAALTDPGPPGPRTERARAFAAEVAVDRYEALFREVAAGNGA